MTTSTGPQQTAGETTQQQAETPPQGQRSAPSYDMDEVAKAQARAKAAAEARERAAGW